jgi:hypothetical protein
MITTNYSCRILARMWHARKSRWVIDLVVGLGTTIAEDLQVTNGHPCPLGGGRGPSEGGRGVGPTPKTMVLTCGNVAEVGCLRAGHNNGRMGHLTGRTVTTP